VTDLRDKWRLLLTITTDAELSGADHAVAGVLLDSINAEKGYWYASFPTIAARTGQSTRNVMRCIDRLTKRGYFEATESRGRGHAKTYRPNFGAVERVTALSPIPTLKGDGAVTYSDRERVTPLSEKGDGAVTPTHLLNPVEKTLSVHSHRERGTPDDDPFERFWRIYPSRGDLPNPKKPAAEKFAAVVKRGVDPAEILSGAERYARSIKANGTAPRFVAQGLTWLNQERWRDQCEAEAPPLAVGMV
jgi:hypothetical protein